MKKCLVLVLLSASGVWAQQRADLFELGSGQQKKIFTLEYQREAKEDGVTHLTGLFSDLEGKQVVVDSATFKGSDIIVDKIEQKQTGETAER